MYHCRKTDNNTLRKKYKHSLSYYVNLPPLFFFGCLLLCKDCFAPDGGRAHEGSVGLCSDCVHIRFSHSDDVFYHLLEDARGFALRARCHGSSQHATNNRSGLNSLRVGVVKEVDDGELRVVITPTNVAQLIKAGAAVAVEKGQGLQWL